MITLVHGEDTLNSYQRLSELITTAKEQGLEVIIKDASEITMTTLRQESVGNDLFGARNCLVIKGLLSGTKSKQKDGLIGMLESLSEAEIILYEPKEIAKTALKSLSKAKIELFAINQVIFKFLDVLRPGNNRVILQAWNRLLELGHEPEFVFSMVVRQIRLLIQAKSGASYLKLSPYPKKLILAQANYFTLNQLLDLHRHLYDLDKRLKTGLSSLPVDQLMLQFFYRI